MKRVVKLHLVRWACAVRSASVSEAQKKKKARFDHVTSPNLAPNVWPPHLAPLTRLECSALPSSTLDTLPVIEQASPLVTLQFLWPKRLADRHYRIDRRQKLKKTLLVARPVDRPSVLTAPVLEERSLLYMGVSGVTFSYVSDLLFDLDVRSPSDRRPTPSHFTSFTFSSIIAAQFLTLVVHVLNVAHLTTIMTGFWTPLFHRLQCRAAGREPYPLGVCLFAFPPSSSLFCVEYLSCTVSALHMITPASGLVEARQPPSLLSCVLSLSPDRPTTPLCFHLLFPQFRASRHRHRHRLASLNTFPCAFSLFRDCGLSSSRTTFELTCWVTPTRLPTTSSTHPYNTMKQG